jgi:site-specific DNA-cytosine methylase
VRILVACEASQKVCSAFRALGHEAFSCDVEDCYGGSPEWHIKGDAIKEINGKWDMLIAFPPCTHLCASGARWWAEKRRDGRQQRAIDFVLRLWNAPTRKKVIENPVGLLSRILGKPTQIVQPWQFGHGETKATCLWLSNLPPLTPTDVVEGRDQRIWKMGPSAERSKLRSETYSGIAKAMAQQWGDLA